MTEEFDRLIGQAEVIEPPAKEPGEFQTATGRYRALFERLLTDRERGREIEVPTGFPILDQKLAGGYAPGGLPYGTITVIGAVPKLGKTVFVSQIAEHAARQGYPVVFASYDEGADQVLLHNIARYLGKSRQRLRHEFGGDLPDLLRKRCLGDWTDRLVIGPYRKRTRDALREAVEELVKREQAAGCYQVPLVIVDQLQAAPMADSEREKRHNIDDYLAYLRGVADDFEAAMILVSRLSRATYFQVATAGFKESGGIEYGCDVAGVLHLPAIERAMRDTHGDKEKRQAVDRTLEEELSKEGRRTVDLVLPWLRWGQGFRVRFDFDGAGSRFEERREVVPGEDGDTQDFGGWDND